MGSRMSLAGIVLLVVGLVSSCIGIRSIAIDEIAPSGCDFVTSKAQEIGILHLIVPPVEDLEDRVIADLKANGATKNIRLRLTVRDFLLVIQLYELQGRGEK